MVMQAGKRFDKAVVDVVLPAVFLIGIVVHWIFCVDTTIGKKINHLFIKL